MAGARYAIAVLMGLVLMMLAWRQASPRDPLVREGNAALSTGRVTEAENAYRLAAEIPLERSVALFNLAVLLANRGDQSRAVDTFTEALQSGLPVDQRAWARYNRGVILSKMGRWTEGVHEFKQALLHLPGDQDIRTNLEIAQAHTKAQMPKPKAPPPPDEVRRLLERMPDQSFAFARGRRSTRPVAAGDDW